MNIGALLDKYEQKTEQLRKEHWTIDDKMTECFESVIMPVLYNARDELAKRNYPCKIETFFKTYKDKKWYSRVIFKVIPQQINSPEKKSKLTKLLEKEFDTTFSTFSTTDEFENWYELLTIGLLTIYCGQGVITIRYENTGEEESLISLKDINKQLIEISIENLITWSVEHMLGYNWELLIYD